MSTKESQLKKPKPSKELLDALLEGEIILREIKGGKRKGDNNMEDLINALNED